MTKPTEPKHTPGPWELREGFLIHAEPFGQIANVRAAGRSPYFTTEADANAQLIAVAPEMLEALKDAHPRISDDAFRSRIGALIVRASSGRSA